MALEPSQTPPKGGLHTLTIPPRESDILTFSNYQDICVQHMDIYNLRVDFEKQILIGSVEYECKVLGQEGASELILDTKALEIHNSSIGSSSTDFSLQEGTDALGRPLRISLDKHYEQGSIVKVSVKYSTTKNSTAVQWLNPDQTKDKEGPFLFTQCQAIHARTLIPCQDTPSVKITYSARVNVPERLTAAMSAVRVGDSDPQFGARTFQFEQRVPIPSYLLALVVGVLESRPISDRCSVLAEPSVVDDAAWEFAETEDFLKAGENLLGPYVWGRYDLLVLPPNFPYGGMENPCLTFVTPTLLAKDRSLADVVAHEISHSWTGNLVSNGNWDHFWLNEGFTMMVQRKIVAAVNGEEQFDFDSKNGKFRLAEAIDNFGEGHAYTRLVPELVGVDPDDAFSSVPYEKGFYFLYYLQSLVGRERFDAFLKAYIENHAYSSIFSEDLRAFFNKHFEDDESVVSAVDWERWLHEPGHPEKIHENVYSDKTHLMIEEVAKQWIQNPEVVTVQTTRNWKSPEKIAFLDYLLEKQEHLSKSDPPERLAKRMIRCIGDVYGLDRTFNSEIRFRWLRLNIRSGAHDIIPFALEFLKEQGRMKYVCPLFQEMMRFKNFRETALELYAVQRTVYHPICAKAVESTIQSFDNIPAKDQEQWNSIHENCRLPEDVVKEAEAASAQSGAPSLADKIQTTQRDAEKALQSPMEKERREMAEKAQEERDERNRKIEQRRQEILNYETVNVASNNKKASHQGESSTLTSRLRQSLNSALQTVGEIQVSEDVSPAISSGIAAAGALFIGGMTVYIMRKLYR